MKLMASGVEIFLSIVVMCCGIYLGWVEAEKEKEGKKAPIMLGVLFSTFFPIGFGLYLYFWELKPAFSSACGKQGWLGVLCFVVFRVVAYKFPAPTW